MAAQPADVAPDSAAGMDAQDPALQAPRRPSDWERLREFDNSGAPDLAIGLLKEMFERRTNKDDRVHITQELLARGVKDAVYFDYLAGFARQAVESDMPCPLQFDEQGLPVRKAVDPSLVKWCEDRQLPAAEGYRQAWMAAVDVRHLAETRDPRAFELLIRGLGSPNCIVVSSAAKGLGPIGDPRAIRPLIELAGRVPTTLHTAIGESLLYFDDFEAQATAQRIIKPSSSSVTAEGLIQSMRGSIAKERARRKGQIR